MIAIVFNLPLFGRHSTTFKVVFGLGFAGGLWIASKHWNFFDGFTTAIKTGLDPKQPDYETKMGLPQVARQWAEHPPAVGQLPSNSRVDEAYVQFRQSAQKAQPAAAKPASHGAH